jgi:hypothetical protein
LTKDAWYRVSFDLDIHSGGVAVIVVQNNQPLGAIDHEIPVHAAEEFAFQFPGGPPASLIVSAWNPSLPRDVDLTIRNVTLTRVELRR